MGIAFNPVEHAMGGQPTALANGVLCSPVTGSALVGIRITGFGKAAVKVGDAPALEGVTGATCATVNGVTTLSWTRRYDNRVANYTQLNITGTTRVQ